MAAAQAAGAQAAPAFEVATVKLTAATDRSSSGIATGHSRLDARNVTIRRCIMGAWDVGPHQVVGGPEWMNAERFDILAKTARPEEDDAVYMLMLRGLLVERFRLAVHTELRTMNAYVLEPAKSGPALGKPQPGESIDNTSQTETSVRIDSHHTTMDGLARMLARTLDLPVVNQTGLAGAYTFQLHWLPQTGNAAALSGSDEVPLETAIQQQLGLRLRVAKVPVAVLVVDRLERPSAN